jgi:hypothetical protein
MSFVGGALGAGPGGLMRKGMYKRIPAMAGVYRSSGGRLRKCASRRLAENALLRDASGLAGTRSQTCNSWKQTRASNSGSTGRGTACAASLMQSGQTPALNASIRG